MDKDATSKGWQKQIETFREMSARLPKAPAELEQSGYLSRYGTVFHAVATRKTRSEGLQQEWAELAQNHLPLHEAGLQHLRHLEEQVHNAKVELERRAKASDRTLPKRRPGLAARARNYIARRVNGADR